jgi:hypothetical protein
MNLEKIAPDIVNAGRITIEKIPSLIKYLLLLIIVILLSIPLSIIFLREYFKLRPITTSEYHAIFEFIIYLLLAIWLLSKAVIIFTEMLYFLKNRKEILKNKYFPEDVNKLSPTIDRVGEENNNKKEEKKITIEEMKAKLYDYLYTSYYNSLPAEILESKKINDSKDFALFSIENNKHRIEELYQEIFSNK